MKTRTIKAFPFFLKFIFGFFFLFNLTEKTVAQNNDFEAGFMNVGIGSILGGVGALINKRPEEKFGKILFKGMGQGALGGYLVFESKRLVREFAKSGNYTYIWPSKIVNSVGTSIIENAAAKRDLWARWHLNIGFNRLEINTKENFKLSYRIMPMDLLATAYQAVDAKPDWKMSVRVGTFVFRTSEIGQEIGYYGRAFGNSIQLLDNIYGDLALPHEIIHTYQYESFSGFNNYFDTTEARFSKNHQILKIYRSIFYTDYNLLLGGLISIIDNPKRLNEGIIESEARYFGNSDLINKIRYN
ncbi:hypothetical protein [Gramella sp. AN32]|uniref:Uncharacterized protein n=1 Tax=Christiangramia antarctica TaxID=2058158 RepID=A0ABW5WZW0_9FLAO|nr:hypothetical protein [Gramella sp. AN32]